MEYDEIEKIILLCKKYGITSFDAEGVKFKFAESNLSPPDEGFHTKQELASSVEALREGVMPPDDQMLFAASEGLPSEEETKE